MTLNDAILAATGGPTVNDGLRSWFSLGVANPNTYTLNDLQFRWCKIQMPASTKTTLNDIWDEYLTTVWGLLLGTVNDKELVYWKDNVTLPPPGANEHYLTIGDGTSAYGFLTAAYGAITPATVGAGTIQGLYVGGNDVMYLEFVGGIQLAGVLNIEVRTPNGRVICAWTPASLSYKAAPYSGLYAAMAAEVDSTVKITIVTL